MALFQAEEGRPEPQESGKPGALVEQRGDWLDESPVNQAGE